MLRFKNFGKMYAIMEYTRYIPKNINMLNSYLPIWNTISIIIP